MAGEEQRHEQEEPERQGPAPRPGGTRVWRVLGITVAVVAVVVGLGFVGYVALIAIALNSWGSNK